MTADRLIKAALNLSQRDDRQAMSSPTFFTIWVSVYGYTKRCLICDKILPTVPGYTLMWRSGAHWDRSGLLEANEKILLRNGRPDFQSISWDPCEIHAILFYGPHGQVLLLLNPFAKIRYRRTLLARTNTPKRYHKLRSSRVKNFRTTQRYQPVKVLV